MKDTPTLLVDIKEGLQKAENNLKALREFQDTHAEHFMPGQFDHVDGLWERFKAAADKIINEGATAENHAAFRTAHTNMVNDYFWCCAVKESTPTDIAEEHEHKRHKTTRDFTVINLCINELSRQQQGQGEAVRIA